MAYYLPFDGSNDYVSFNDIYPNGTTGFDFSITWEPTQLNTSYDIIIGNNTGMSGSRHAIYQRLNELEVAFIIGGSRRLINTSGAGLSVGTVKTLRVTYNGSNLTVFIDGTQVGQVSASGTVSATAGGLKRFGRNDLQYGHIKLYSAEFKDSVNGTVINSYNPTISERAGDSLLIDEVSGNHGTLSGFSSTPFVYYYDFLNPSEEDTTTDNCLKLTSASESISLPLIGSYNVDAHLTDGTTVNFTGSGTLLIDGTTPREITKIVGNDSNNDVFYDCNQSPERAPVVPELINGQNGTMTGFPEPSGYVKDANNEIVGYRFNGVNSFGYIPSVITLPAANDFTIEIDITTPTLESQSYYGLLGKIGTFTPRFQLDFTGHFNFQLAGSSSFSDNFAYQSDTDYVIKITKVGLLVKTFVNGTVTSSNTLTTATDTLLDQFGKVANGQGYSKTIFKRISIISGTISHNYDFTAGDSDQIIDTAGGNNATIWNNPTAGYRPIIEKQVFTVDDYATLPLFVTAQSANSDYREYLVGTTAGATISGFSDGVILNGGTVTSPITLTQTGIAQIKNATLDDVDATGATGDVTIIDCEVEDVTG